MPAADEPDPLEDRRALEALLGPAEALDAHLLRWTSTQLPGGDGARAGRPYDPDRHEAVYYHHDPPSALRALIACTRPSSALAWAGRAGSPTRTWARR